MSYQELEFTNGFSIHELLKGRSNCVGISFAEKGRLEKKTPPDKLVKMALVEEYCGDNPTRHVTVAVLSMEKNGSIKVLFVDRTPWRVDGDFFPWGYHQVTGGRYVPISWSISSSGEVFPSTLEFKEEIDGVLTSPFRKVQIIPDEVLGYLDNLDNKDLEIKEKSFPGLEFEVAMKKIEKLRSEGRLTAVAAECCLLIEKFPSRIVPFFELYSILSSGNLEFMIEETFPEIAFLNNQEKTIYLLIRAAELYRKQRERWQKLVASREEIICRTAQWRIKRAEEGLERIKRLLPPSNWGIIIFKPPRATLPEIFPRLRRLLEERTIEKGLSIHGPICFNLTEGYLKIIYPEDYTQPYWPSLLENLLHRDAFLFLLKDDGRKDDIGEKFIG